MLQIDWCQQLMLQSAIAVHDVTCVVIWGPEIWANWLGMVMNGHYN
jgi:hypothetical protein